MRRRHELAGSRAPSGSRSHCKESAEARAAPRSRSEEERPRRRSLPLELAAAPRRGDAVQERLGRAALLGVERGFHPSPLLLQPVPEILGAVQVLERLPRDGVRVRPVIRLPHGDRVVVMGSEVAREARPRIRRFRGAGGLRGRSRSLCRIPHRVLEAPHKVVSGLRPVQRVARRVARRRLRVRAFESHAAPRERVEMGVLAALP